jgi:hypothetical protein
MLLTGLVPEGRVLYVLLEQEHVQLQQLKQPLLQLIFFGVAIAKHFKVWPFFGASTFLVFELLLVIFEFFPLSFELELIGKSAKSFLLFLHEMQSGL